MKRSKHSLSHYRLTSLNTGTLFPVMCEEVLPGDSWRQQSSVLVRVSPLVAPVMHPVQVSIHHWFVPSRLVWSNWEDFITGVNTALVVPTLTVNMTSDAAAAQMAQSLGVGADTATVTLSALPFRAYNQIYNEFYRDQDLIPKLVESVGNGPDAVADYALRKVAWEKDYFTTARPYPQQGADTEVVNLTITGDMTVRGIGIAEADRTFPVAGIQVRESDNVVRTYAQGKQTATAAGMYVEGTAAAAGRPNIRVPAGTSIQGGMDINDWRKAMAMQRMREHRNRFGSRYRDMLAFLGVTSSDARLQRPEYLGGGKQTVSFSEVLATAEGASTVVGDMAGHGIAALRTRPFKRFFEEHGYVFSMVFARPQSVYLNRVPRHFLRRDYDQYWQKELEMMGEQEITNFEVYGDSGTPAGVFGYIPRYDEYRHGESSVSGEFRTILDYWHMARDFSSQPVLNSSFVNCIPTDRIYASTDTDELYVMVAHRISARRLVSKRARS